MRAAMGQSGAPWVTLPPGVNPASLYSFPSQGVTLGVGPVGLYLGAGCGTELQSYVLKRDPWRLFGIPGMASVLLSPDAGVCGKDSGGKCHQPVRGKGCGEGSSCDIAHLCTSIPKQTYKPKTRLIFGEADEVVTVGGGKPDKVLLNSSWFVLTPLITVSVEQ